MADYSELKRKAQEIKDEVKAGANTANRVGLALEETVKALEVENKRAEQAEESLENAVQMLQDETEDLKSIRDNVERLGSDKADKSALEATNKEVSKKQNKLDNYKEDPCGSVEIFAQDFVSMANDSQGGVSCVEVYNEEGTEGIIPVARMSADKENGDYASVTVRGNEVHIEGDGVKVNGKDLESFRTTVINDLTTGGADKALSAEMGKMLGMSVKELEERVHDLGDFGRSSQAEAEAGKADIAGNPGIVLIRYTVGNKNGIILQQVDEMTTKQILFWGSTQFQRHINFSSSDKTSVSSTSPWWKMGATHTTYDAATRRLHLQDMNYNNLNPSIDAVLPLASETQAGLMSKEQVTSLKGKQDQLANYVEIPRGKTTIKYPNGTARVEVSKVLAALWANDDKVAIAADANGTRMLYTKTAEDGYIEHRDEISIGRHDENRATHITLTSKSTTEEAGEKSTNTSTIQVNPDGIAMSSPSGEIDDVVKEIAAHQNDGIELLANGNLKLTLKGETREFMPATPSGDPMHWAYVSAGAEYNDTDDFILKDAPWKDMVDTIEDKAKWGFDVVDASKVKQMTIKGVEYNYATENRTSPEGGTYLRYFIVGKGSNGVWVEDETKVLHLPKCWYLNGLGDITNAEMLRCYEESPKNVGNFVTQQFGKWSKARTLNARISAYSVVDVSYLFVSNGNIEVPNIDWVVYNISHMFLGANRIRYVLNIRYPSNPSIDVGYCNTAARIDGAFSGATSLRGCFLSGLVQSVSFSRCGNISKPSILKAIKNATPSSAITITLHHDAYERLKGDADILQALTTKNADLATKGNGKVSLVCATDNDTIPTE